MNEKEYEKMVEEMTNKEYIKFVNRCLDTNTRPKAVAKEYLKKCLKEC